LGRGDRADEGDAVRNKPTTDRGRETADRIIDAAAALFYERGVRATGLDQISEASGTGKGQIYHYFVDKADLVLAVIERQTERVLQSQEPLLSTISTWNELDEWLALLAQMNEASDGPMRCPLGSLVVQLAEEDPAAREALAGGFDRWVAKIAEALERLQRAGELDRRADCARIARGAIATYQGGLLLAEAQGDLTPLHAALATARDALAAHAPTSAPRRRG
jgi:TetR/AcrR family transcriptional regulator, transcriptional repressor for nem operon